MNTTKHVKISEQNAKLGRICNISVEPIASCPNSILCREFCYAKPIYDRLEVVRAAWGGNWEMFKNSPRNYRDSIIYMINHGKRGTSGLFRWHVGGDIVNQEYLQGMMEVADKTPELQHLAFTKSYHLDFSGIPGNMHIVASAWAGSPINTELPIAYVSELDNRVEDHEVIHDCLGNCRECRKCWEAKNGEAIRLHLHGPKWLVAKALRNTHL